MGLFVGLDVGTTSVSAVALDADAARVVAAVSRPHGAGRTGAVAGRAELDVDALWEVTQGVLAAVAADVGDRRAIGALGVTGQMHGLALVGSDGTPVAPSRGRINAERNPTRPAAPTWSGSSPRRAVPRPLRAWAPCRPPAT